MYSGVKYISPMRVDTSAPIGKDLLNDLVERLNRRRAASK